MCAYNFNIQFRVPAVKERGIIILFFFQKYIYHFRERNFDVCAIRVQMLKSRLSDLQKSDANRNLCHNVTCEKKQQHLACHRFVFVMFD